MALIHSLMRYKNKNRIEEFEMHGEKKATVRLANLKSFVVYMSSDYIIGEAEIQEAADAPSAKFVVYNNWDNIGQGAFREAQRLGMEVHKFGAFGHRLDEFNAGI